MRFEYDPGLPWDLFDRSQRLAKFLMLRFRHFQFLKPSSRRWSDFRPFSFSAWGAKKKPYLTEERYKKGQGSLCIPDDPLEFTNLKNGMRLITEYKCSDVTTIGFFLSAGSMHEECEERGASLFMEHLIFRQTKCRDQNRIEQELEEIGGKLGAVATRDLFLFWGTVPSRDIKKLLILLGDIIKNGVIVSDEIVRERFTILRELEEIETDGERTVMDYLKTIAYQETELSKSLYPKTRVIKSLSAETVSRFRNRLFKPSLMTMVCTGGTASSEAENYANECIIDCDKDSLQTPDSCLVEIGAALPKYRFSAIDMRLRDDDEKLAHVALAVETSGFSEPLDHCALTVAKETVGSWDMTCGGSGHNAPLVAHQAFDSNLCHVYKSFNISWTSAGLWGCYFACDKMLLQDMLFTIQNEWLRLCKTITEKEIERAVNQCRTRELMRLNDSVERFFDIATSLSRCRRYKSIAQRVCEFDEVNANSVRDVAMKYIYDRCPAIAAIGPVENLPDYNRIRASMYRLRY